MSIGNPLLIRDGRTLGEQGIQFFDLTGLYRDYPEATYADNCCHLNQRGLDLMAYAVAQAILEGRVAAGETR